ncbi:MAG: SHOCT domain-containing protein [Saprospiraceae bacterium]
MNEKRYKADSIIKNHVMFATGAGAIPIPLLDFAGVTAVQLDMMKKLTNLYNDNYSENVGKAFIASVTSTSLARMGASLIKAIPGIGTALGVVSMSIMSGASTYALGNVITHFLDKGIGLEDINEDMARKVYEENLEKGKKVAEELKNRAEEKMEEMNDDDFDIPTTSEDAEPSSTPNNPPPKAAPENDVYAELMKLGDLRDKGIITDEEFAKMKKEIIDKF